jgi:hypothetical protein
LELHRVTAEKSMASEYVWSQTSSKNIFDQEGLLLSQKRNHTERCWIAEMVKLESGVSKTRYDKRCYLFRFYSIRLAALVTKALNPMRD